MKWFYPATVIFGTLCASCAYSNTQMEVGMSDAAERYIAAFEREEGFDSPPGDLIAGGMPAASAVERLRQELERAEGGVREGIVDLLADLAIQTDPVVHDGAATIRNPGIVAILANEGCAKADQGCLAAMDALRTSVPINFLMPHKARFASLLETYPSESALLLVAKAKVQDALPTVTALGKDAGWADSEAIAIAKAALGDAREEAAFKNGINSADSGEALAEALGPAGLAGTPDLIDLIAEQMRTPFTIDRPGVNEVSVRLNVMDALRYNFPAVPEFYTNNVHSDEDYLRIESLLVEKLGISFDRPRPDFLKVRGYPIPLTPVE